MKIARQESSSRDLTPQGELFSCGLKSPSYHRLEWRSSPSSDHPSPRSGMIRQRSARRTPTLCQNDRAGVLKRLCSDPVRKTNPQAIRANIVAQKIAPTAIAAAAAAIEKILLIFLTSSQKVSSKLKGDFRPLKTNFEQKLIYISYTTEKVKQNAQNME